MIDVQIEGFKATASDMFCVHEGGVVRNISTDGSIMLVTLAVPPGASVGYTDFVPFEMDGGEIIRLEKPTIPESGNNPCVFVAIGCNINVLNFGQRATVVDGNAVEIRPTLTVTSAAKRAITNGGDGQ